MQDANTCRWWRTFRGYLTTSQDVQGWARKLEVTCKDVTPREASLSGDPFGESCFTQDDNMYPLGWTFMRC